MDYQFENVQHYNQKMCLEFQYRQRKNIVLWGLLCLGAGLTEIYAALNGEKWSWAFATTFLALAAYYLFLPYFKERKRVEGYFAQYSGDNSPARVRFGDIIRIEDHSAVMHMDYDQIQQVIALKRGLFLRWNDNAYLAIDPNCFTKGTYEEFKRFLREKRPDLAIPD